MLRQLYRMGAIALAETVEARMGARRHSGGQQRELRLEAGGQQTQWRASRILKGQERVAARGK